MKVILFYNTPFFILFGAVFTADHLVNEGNCRIIYSRFIKILII